MVPYIDRRRECLQQPIGVAGSYYCLLVSRQWDSGATSTCEADTMVRNERAADTLSTTWAGVQSPREGRQRLEMLLPAEFDRLSDSVGSAVLATSELVTNAITAAGKCDLRASFEPATSLLRVEVRD